MRCGGWCPNLRSAVFFGASIQIFLGALQFIYFLVQVFFYIQNKKHPEKQPSLTLISFLMHLVGALFFPLGCAIFRGVEKEKLSLIRYPSIIFLLLKIVDLTLRYYHEFNILNPSRVIGWEERFYQAIDISGSMAYFTLLFLYHKSLVAQNGEGTSSNYCRASDVDDLSMGRRKNKALMAS